MPFFGYEDETLLKNFNYDKYMLSYRQYVESIQSPLAFYKHAPSNGLNVLPDGSVCGITTMNIYGTVEDDMSTILKRKLEVGDFEALCRTEELSNSRSMQFRVPVCYTACM